MNVRHNSNKLILNCLSTLSEEPEHHSDEDVFEEIKEWLTKKGIKEGNPQTLVEEEKDNQKLQVWKSLPSKPKMKEIGTSALLTKRKQACLRNLKLRE